VLLGFSRPTVLVSVALVVLGGCGGMSSEHGTVDDAGSSAGGATAGAIGLGHDACVAGSGDAVTNVVKTGDAAPATALSVKDDPSRISALTECALAQGGHCVVPLAHTKHEVCRKFASDWPKQASADYTLPQHPCAPAALGPGAQADALRRLNYYRWLSNLPPVDTSDEWSGYAAACAIIQAHRSEPTHSPSPDATCYSAPGALASSQSLIDLRAHTPADAIDDLVWDAGQRNSHELGHRWALLHPGLTRIGLGFSYPAGETRATCVRETAGQRLERAKDLTGVVAYPSFGRTPYELVSREASASPVDEALQWSVTFDESVALGSASARVYRAGRFGYEPVPTSSGPIQTFHGLWLELTQGPATPGTYLVLVTGTGLGDFGYRTTFERCGADTPLTCDVYRQDCGAAGYGCYEPGAPFCTESGNVPTGFPCKGNLPSECAPGSVCVENSGARDGYTCAAYCDPNHGSSDKSCDALCRGNYVVFDDIEHGGEAGAYCDPATGSACAPLTPSCPAGQGCYGFKPPRCVTLGSAPKGAACHFANDCAPGLACIGSDDSKCLPYCDVKAASGPQACKTLCPGAFWDYDSFGVCRR
jgi:hypothetical protein